MFLDVDYLVQKAQNNGRLKQFSRAKSYLLAAISLEPNNPLIKAEMYKIHRMECDLENLLPFFVDLFLDKPKISETKIKIEDEPSESKIDEESSMNELFIIEMKNLLYSISNEWSHCFQTHNFFDETNDQSNLKIYADLWRSLDDQQQFQCLVKFCRSFPQCHELLIDLHLYILMKYSNENVFNSALELMRILDSDVVDSKFRTHLQNQYVSRILPGLVSHKKYCEENQQQTYTNFIAGLRYYVNFLITNEQLEMNDVEPLETKLLEAISTIGEHYGWNVFEKNQLLVKDFEQNINNLISYIQKFYSKEDNVLDLSNDKQVDQSIILNSISMFVILFGRFKVKIQNSVILERLSLNLQSMKTPMNIKKQKLMMSVPDIFCFDKDLLKTIDLVLRFNTTIDFLHQEFNDLISRINLNQNYYYVQYKIFNAFYTENYNNGWKLLQSIKFFDTKEDENDIQTQSQYSTLISMLKYHLQCLVFSNKMNNLDELYHHIIELIKLLDVQANQMHSNNSTIKFRHLLPSVSNQCSKSNQINNQKKVNDISYCDAELFGGNQTNRKSKQILIIQPTIESVIGVLVDACFIMFAAIKHEDSFFLGSKIILSQYQWPYFYQIFTQTFNAIVNIFKTLRESNQPISFRYPLFSTYYFVTDVLEEIEALSNDYDPICLQLDPDSFLDTREKIHEFSLKMLNRSENFVQTELIYEFIGKQILPYIQSIPSIA
ncbi:hypothetical protein SSS_05881 [Sarcoptes scabiei]|uniref:Integrator complex subunit 10 n=2 Tax=Sarcoptes scabiei TaxID=52283 RepID=A0A834VBB4_SARSC|nr:hypothetical protein SSS_05881 [Sarcoptes scabiei]